MNIPNDRQVKVRVYVDRTYLTDLVDSDGAALTDSDDRVLGITPLSVVPIEITDRVLRGSINLGDVSSAGTGSSGVDAVVANLTLDLDHSNPNLAPLTDSVLNAEDDVLRPYRRIRVTATVDGTTTQLFSGYLGDDIRTTATVGSSRITLTARDLSKPLQDLFLDEFPVIAATAPVGVVAVIEELLQLVPSHVRPPLIVEGSPTFEVREPYRPQNCSIWDAAQQLVAQTGWHLGARGSSLVLLDPPRAKLTADWSVDEDDVYQDDLGISDADVRNVVRVVWTDSATRERRTTEARDEWSIDNLTGGVPRLSVIALDATSQIDTETEAQALATRFIHDMAREFAATQLTLPFLPSVKLFDTIRVTHKRFTADPRLTAVVSLRHDFTPASARTVVIGTGQVIGRRRAWLAGEPRPGSPSDPRGPHAAVLPAPLVTVTDGNPGVVVRVDERRGVDAQGVEIHWSLVNGFIPDATTLKARGGQEVWTFAATDVSAPDHIIPGVVHYVRVRAFDSQNVGGEWTPQMAVVPSKVDPAAIVLDADVEVNGDIDIYGARGNSGTLKFYEPGAPPEIVLALGAVGGLFGAPPGAVGLAGGMGAGIWLRDALQVVDAGYSQFDLDFGNPAAGTLVTRTASLNLSGAFTMPSNNRDYMVVIPGGLLCTSGQYGRVLSWNLQGLGDDTDPMAIASPILVEGRSYDSLDIFLNMTIETMGTGVTKTYSVPFFWLRVRSVVD